MFKLLRKIKRRLKFYWDSKQYSSVLHSYGYRRSLKEGSCVDVNGNPLPWYTYPTIEYLTQIDFSNKRVFEFGSGNSSLWWAVRAKEVVSVEHNENWYNTRLAFGLPNLTIHLRMNKESYCDCLSEQEGLFDVIVIDGVYRDACVAVALSKLNKEGMIIFDNSDRAFEFLDYHESMQTIRNAGFLEFDFYGFGPLNPYTWCTSIFITKTFNFSTKQLCQPVKGINALYEK